MKIAIIGAGNVGGGLAAAATKAGHTVVVSAADVASAQKTAANTGATAATSNTEAVQAADVVVLAVPGSGVADVVTELGQALTGKVVINAANALTADYSDLFTTGISLAETVQQQAPGARVVSALGTIFAGRYANPVEDGQPLDALFAGDDADATATVAQLVQSLGFRPVDAGSLRIRPLAGGDGLPQHQPERRQRLGLAERVPPRRPAERRLMAGTVNPVRLNHAVLFVADLARAETFYTGVIGIRGRRPGAPRERRVPAPAPLGQPPRPRPVRRRRGRPAQAAAAGSGCTTWPGRSTRSTSWPRPGTSWRTRTRSPASPATARPRASTAPTPTATSSRSCGCCRGRRGASSRTAAPVDRLDLQAELARWTGVRTAARVHRAAAAARRAHDRVPLAGRGDRRRPTTRRRRWWCCCTAAAPTSGEIIAPRRPPPGGSGVRGGARAHRRGRRLRLVRQPRHRPPRRRVAAQPRWTGSAPGSTRSPPPAGPVVLVGFSGGAAFAGGLLLDDPARYAGAAVLYGTLPFDAGVPTTPARLAGVPVVVAQGEQDTVIPRELLDRTWSYLLGESGAPTVALRHPGGHGITADALGTVAGWLQERLGFLARRGTPEPGPTTWSGLPGGQLHARAGVRPAVTPGIPQEQRSDNAPLALQEQMFARIAALPGVTTRQSAISVPGARGFMLTAPRGPQDAFLVPSAGEFAHVHPGHDGSLHLALPMTLAADLVAKGWGVAHPFAGVRLTPGFVMLFGPRDDAELETVLGVVRTSHAWASGLVPADAGAL